MWIVKTSTNTGRIDRKTVVRFGHDENDECRPPIYAEVYQADISILGPEYCQPIPMTYVYPAGNEGDIWRCDVCYKLWRVAKKCDYCDIYGKLGGPCRTVQHLEGYKWRSDGLFLRSIFVALKLGYKALTVRIKKTTHPNQKAT